MYIRGRSEDRTNTIKTSVCDVDSDKYLTLSLSTDSDFLKILQYCVGGTINLKEKNCGLFQSNIPALA
jgi:hypothetical protein